MLIYGLYRKVSIVLSITVYHINVKIIHSKFKNNQNFKIFLPSLKKTRTLEVKLVFNSLTLNTTRKYELSIFRNKKMFAQLFLTILAKLYFFFEKLKKIILLLVIMPLAVKNAK